MEAVEAVEGRSRFSGNPIQDLFPGFLELARGLGAALYAGAMALGFWKRRARGGKVWYTRLHGEDVSTGCTDLPAARLWRARMERDNADPAKAPAPLGELLREMVADRRRAGRAPATLKILEQKSAQLVKLLGEKTDAHGLRRGELESYIDAREAAGISRHTVAKELKALRLALRLAMRRGRGRWALDELMPEYSDGYQPRQRVLTPAELTALLAELEGERRVFVAFLTLTGMRLSEAARACWADVTPDGGWLAVRGTKTKKSPRVIPLLPELAELLEPLRPAPGGGPGKKGLDSPIFGEWKQLHRDIKRACKRAGIAPCSPNDFRRTWCSWLRNRDVEAGTVAALLGNSRLMVDRVYGVLSPAAKLRAVEQAAASTAVALGPLLHATARADAEKTNNIVGREGFEPSTNGLKGRSQGTPTLPLFNGKVRDADDAAARTAVEFLLDAALDAWIDGAAPDELRAQLEAVCSALDVLVRRARRSSGGAA